MSTAPKTLHITIKVGDAMLKVGDTTQPMHTFVLDKRIHRTDRLAVTIAKIANNNFDRARFGVTKDDVTAVRVLMQPSLARSRYCDSLYGIVRELCRAAEVRLENATVELKGMIAEMSATELRRWVERSRAKLAQTRYEAAV